MKKMNNKGFSLVELIIVIAIMAILIAVLAPQYLRYVEKSRLQSDNSAIGEVANAAKVALANDTVNNDAASGATISLPAAGTKGAVTCGVSSLKTEIDNVVGANVQLKSNAYKNAGTQPTIGVSVVGGVTYVSGNNVILEVNGTPTTVTY